MTETSHSTRSIFSEEWIFNWYYSEDHGHTVLLKVDIYSYNNETILSFTSSKVYLNDLLNLRHIGLLTQKLSDYKKISNLFIK